MEFAAPKSTWIKVITAVLFAVMILLAALAFLTETDASGLIMPAVIFVIVLALSYYFSITRYEITETHIVIHRPFDQVKIRKSAIANVLPIDKKDIRLSIRTFGIGGVFAYTGQFWNSKFGNMTWYLSRMDNVVLLIDTSNRKTLLSPDNREKFIAALKS